MLEGRHAAPELVGLARREPRALDGDAHRLLLEERDAKRLAEHALEFRFGVVDRLLAFAPAQIRMHHVALDRPRPDDRDLDDEVVEGARLDARQHRHLRAAFDLKHADGVGLADHRVGARILGRDGREIEPRALVRGEEIEGAAHAAEHAEAEHVDLHEFQGIDVVLVPFDDGAFSIAAGSIGTSSSSRSWVRTKPPGMLRQMPGRADKLPRQIERQAQAAVGQVEIELGGKLGLDAFIAPTPDLEAKALVTSSVRPSALPTSRMAPRAR